MGEILLVLTLFLPPVFLWTSAKDSFRLPKLMLASWLALASALCFVWLLRRVPRCTVRDLAALPALRAVVPLLVVATASLVTSAHRAHVVEGLADLWIGAVALVAWSLALPADRLRRFLQLLWLPAAVLGLIGVLQAHALWQPLQFTQRYVQGRLSVTSLAGNPGDLSAFLVLPCLVLEMQIWASRRGRWWRLGLLALCLYAAAVTQSLTPLIALLVASAVFWGLLLPWRRSLAVLGAGVAATALLLVVIPPLGERVLGKVRDVRGGDLNHLLTGRLDGWRAAAWMFAEHPVLGIGHGAFAAEFSTARLALVDRGVTFFRSQDTPVFANAHNEYLEVAAESGLLGLAALAWGIWVLLARARRIGAGGGRAHADTAERTHRLADRALAWAGLTALGLLALTFFPLRAAMIAYPWLLFLAWLLRRAAEEAPA